MKDMEDYEIDDDDAPELTDYQLKIMDLVYSHEGVRGIDNSDKRIYLQGMEEERVRTIKSIMQSLNMSPVEAMTALKIPTNEHAKYQAAI